MDITELFKNYPFINAVFIGIGMGGGIYAGINKLFDLFIAIKINTNEIPSISNNLDDIKDYSESQSEEIKKLKKIIEKHDIDMKEKFDKGG
jgi:adenine C2-methylase RlmN of 23S rRNA A2503 and tRNA A37